MIKTLRIIAAIMCMVVAMTCCTKPDEPKNDGGDDGYVATVVPHNGGSNDSVTHGFVDLGLSSGRLWATCNVGADTPEEFGDYFAWGETTTKEVYDWKCYKYSTYVEGDFRLNKYCADPAYGFNGYVDNLTVLETSDDAALASWGTGWRMPTMEDWEELFLETTKTWVEVNGVEGLLITGENGNSIFLPAAGYRDDSEFISSNIGVYWSSTLQTKLEIVAWSFHLTPSWNHVCGSYERARGQVIRAVRSTERCY